MGFARTEDIKDAARGRWRGILMALGVPAELLPPRKDKHVPCPICGGKDRFRFDDKEGRGTWICNQCGAGDGFSLLMQMRSWNFAEAKEQVRQVLGVRNIPASAPAPEEDPKVLLARAGEQWKSGGPVLPGSPVDLYLRGRGLGMDIYPDCLRFHPEVYHPIAKRSMPAMLAKVVDETGAGVNIHRTFITMDGRKADVEDPKRLMKGQLPHGACIRLGPAAPIMGVAEGIETALAASRRWGIPVWSTISAALLAEWIPPAVVRTVLVFGDNDAGFAGQACAYALARRLKVKKLDVEVHIPQDVGKDWADYV